MSVNQNDLVEIVRNYGLSRRQALKVVQTWVRMMKESLLRGEPVETPAGLLQLCKVAERTRAGRMRSTRVYVDTRKRRRIVLVKARSEYRLRFVPTVEFPDET